MKVRKVIAEKDIPIERAIRFLKENPKFGVIIDNNLNEVSLEELENAKDFRPEIRIGSDNNSTAGREVSESSDRELIEAFNRSKREINNPE
jgi:hypothetical protein